MTVWYYRMLRDETYDINEINVTSEEEGKRLFDEITSDLACEMLEGTIIDYQVELRNNENAIAKEPAITLNAEWISYMKAYRLYDPKYPQQTVAYVDSLEDAERPGYNIVLADADTMHEELY